MKRTADVLIPVYHPGKELEQLLSLLEAQDYPVNRIILMNTEEACFPAEILKDHPKAEVHHVTRAEFDHGGTRDQGIRMSDADVVICMTQDAIPADEHMAGTLLKAFDDPEVWAAYARQLPKENCREVEKYTRSFNYPEESRIKGKEDLPILGIKTFFCSNVCAAYDREVYEKLGGFVDHAIFNEDMIYAGNLVKKGYAIAYAADAKVYHSHNYSALQQFHRNFDLGVSQAEHPEIFANVPSEGEGIRLVKKSLAYLVKTGHIWLIPQLVIQSGAKYAGYFLGKRYWKLPHRLVMACTMSPWYWKQK